MFSPMPADSRPEEGAPKFQTFVDLIRSMQRLAEEVDLPTFYETLIQASGYGEMLSAKTDHESKSRLENIHELSSSISGYLEHAEDPSWEGSWTRWLCIQIWTVWRRRTTASPL